MVSMNIAARNHCSRPMARHLHGHNVCAEIAPKALSRLNFQVKQSGKFGLATGSAASSNKLPPRSLRSISKQVGILGWIHERPGSVLRKEAAGTPPSPSAK